MTMDEDKLKLRKIEQANRDAVDELPEFEVSVTPLDVEEQDARDFVESMFYDFLPGAGNQRKKIYYAHCEGNQVPDVPAGHICVLLNYKMKRAQGKRDPLGGSHVLVVPTPKGHRITPLHQVRKYALNMLRAMDAIEDALVELDVPLRPDVD